MKKNKTMCGECGKRPSGYFIKWKTLMAITENSGKQIPIMLCAYNAGERHVIEKE